MISSSRCSRTLIWSCALGLAINLVNLPLPGPLVSYAEILGRASLAAGLLVVGSGLDLTRLKRPSAALHISLVLKLIVLPLIAVTFARLIGVTGTGLAVTVICTAVPTASGSYVLARQMGGDAPLMAEILTVQTLIAMMTMPLALGLFLIRTISSSGRNERRSALASVSENDSDAIGKMALFKRERPLVILKCNLW